MKIGIDASNIRTGGGKKHLEHFVINSIKEFKEIEFVIVSNKNINSMFSTEIRVTTITNPFLNINGFFSLISQFFFSKFYFRSHNCKVIFVPGGIFLSSFKPFITMSQNMLPFDNSEMKRFEFLKRFKFKLIKYFQILTFNKSNGIIFLSDYAREVILNKIKTSKNNVVIPHGIEIQKKNNYLQKTDYFEILYISDFLPYKHQFNVVKAIKELIIEGHNIQLTLIGQTDKNHFKKIKSLINENDDLKKRIKIKGKIDFFNIPDYFKKSTLFLFASTCENLPFILLEAISYGMPVICSNKRPMCDMVYGEKIFFNSTDTDSIKEIIKNNLDYQKLQKISNENYLLSKKYNWTKNVKNTIRFIESQV